MIEDWGGEVIVYLKEASYVENIGLENVRVRFWVRIDAKERLAARKRRVVPRIEDVFHVFRNV